MTFNIMMRTDCVFVAPLSARSQRFSDTFYTLRCLPALMGLLAKSNSGLS